VPKPNQKVRRKIFFPVEAEWGHSQDPKQIGKLWPSVHSKGRCIGLGSVVLGGEMREGIVRMEGQLVHYDLLCYLPRGWGSGSAFEDGGIVDRSVMSCGDLFSIVGVIMLSAGLNMIEFIATVRCLGGGCKSRGTPTRQYLLVKPCMPGDYSSNNKTNAALDTLGHTGNQRTQGSRNRLHHPYATLYDWSWFL
jgi:hypothetical protein